LRILPARWEEKFYEWNEWFRRKVEGWGVDRQKRVSGKG
jgi:hypothetical protein